MSLPDLMRVLVLFPAPAVRSPAKMWSALYHGLSPFLASSSPPHLCLSSHPLPVVVCLGLETLQEGAVSSVALEENPARMLPTRTHSAQPVGVLDPQPRQVS